MSLGERNLIFSFKDFLMKIWVEGGKTKKKDASGFLFIFFIQINITH